MAISRGAGTEIIRSWMGQDVDATQTIITGAAHHIYTILSIVMQCQGKNAGTNKFKFYLVGWDQHAGGTGATHYIVDSIMNVGDTWVWNDKFSFNGTEPTGLSGTGGSVAHADAVADQGTATAQTLTFTCDNAGDNYDIICTYLDQNNA